MLQWRLGDPAYSLGDPAYTASQTVPTWTVPTWTLAGTSPHQQQLESIMDQQIESMSDQQIMNILRLPEGSPAYTAAAAQYSRDLHQQLQPGEGA